VVPWACWRLIRRRLFPTALDNIPGPEAKSWLTGSLLELLDTKNGWDYHRRIAETYGGIIRIKGMLGANHLYVFDPKALHHIILKDQYIYEETDSFIEGNKMIFGEGLLTTLGEKHRRHRKMLNPVFSIAHLREMVPIFYEVAHKVNRTFVQKVQHGPQEVDVLGWMTRLALELIGQSGLGYTFDDLTENSVPHEYGLASKQLVPVQTQKEWMLMNRTAMPILTKIGTPGFRRFLVDHIPSKKIRRLRDIVDTLHRTSVEILNSKRKALEAGDEALAAQIGRGKDVISILMKANMQASEDDRLSEEELLGQITILTFAATDTTSTAISRTLHVLAQRKDVQNKLREEIRKARKENNGQDLGYDDLVSMPYLDAVCRETLRMYSPVTTLMRTARQDIVLPLAKPIKGINGEDVHEIPIPNGTNIHISVLNSNRNPELWGPDAEEWKPERWLNPLPDALIDAHVPGVYSHLMTFLGGGRSCIGFKFSQLEMKVVLTLLLESLEFSLSDKNVFWQMSGIVSPIIGPDATKPSLPMIISLAK
jgi:cytochrome P450